MVAELVAWEGLSLYHHMSLLPQMSMKERDDENSDVLPALADNESAPCQEGRYNENYS
jgi:hypothetical protein